MVIVAVWLGPALILGGDAYRNDVLWRQSAGRMVNAFDHARPAWFFVAALPVLLWPWAWRGPALKMLSPGRIVASWQTRLLAIWFVATVALFSLISGKQIHYMLPALPAAALLLSQAPAPRRAFGPPVLAGMVVVPVLIWALALALGKARIDHAVVAGGMVLPLLVAAVLAAGAVAVLTLMARRAPLLAMALVAPDSGDRASGAVGGDVPTVQPGSLCRGTGPGAGSGHRPCRQRVSGRIRLCRAADAAGHPAASRWRCRLGGGASGGADHQRPGGSATLQPGAAGPLCRR